jgi:ferredoxin--NADP+ reductase
MYLIKEKYTLTPTVTKMIISAPLITKHADVGQFVMIRAEEDGERIPLTIAENNPKDGTITIIFQVVGRSTYILNQLNENDRIPDVAGPMGKPSELEGLSRVLLVGGGVGCAILYPIAEKLHRLGTEIYTIIGFRNESLIFLEDQFVKISNRYQIVTDDGSYGYKGFVTDVLKCALDEHITYDKVIAIGPIPMMKAVSDLTRKYHIPTVVSMNPIMVDGTGMCGGCRLSVGGQMKFACVDGPEFDGHLVDFDMVMKRNQLYQSQEKEAYLDVCKGVSHEQT